jgi:hypothetical protein
MDYETIFEELRALGEARRGSRIQIVMNVNVMAQLTTAGDQAAMHLPGEVTEIWRTEEKVVPPA